MCYHRIMTSLEERFWAKVAKEPDQNGCLNWEKGTSQGYGIFSMRPGPPKRAHVVAFFLREGRWPAAGMHIRHSCGNPLCVLHVNEGTPLQNAEDTGRMGRWNNGRECMTTCPQGHEYDAVDHDGYRSCSVCRNMQARKYQIENRKRLGKVPKSESCSSCYYSVRRCICV